MSSAITCARGLAARKSVALDDQMQRAEDMGDQVVSNPLRMRALKPVDSSEDDRLHPR